MADLLHPKLGNLRGKQDPEYSSVVQYLGLKYANLEDQFAPPQPVKAQKGDIDATEYGPFVVSPPGAVEAEMDIIQQKIPVPPAPPVSGTGCLNLNITGPHKSASDLTVGLPVLAYLHGGGYHIGGNWWPQYDFRRLVTFGVEMGAPFIGVNIAYRLGLPGFLTSAEMREAGYQANNGLRDQVMALNWIKENISGFGGDPDNVTLLGVSAGGISALYHLQSATPLFKRVVSMSGTPLMIKPLPLHVAEHAYQTVFAALGLTDLTPADRIEKLRRMPPEKLLKVPHSVRTQPVLDGELIKLAPSFQSLEQTVSPGAQWCEELMIGWCGYDATIYTTFAPIFSSPSLRSAITESFTKSLPSDELPATLFNVYGLDNPDASQDVVLSSVMRLGTHLIFRNAVLAYAAAWSSSTANSKRAYVYDCEVPNPWKGGCWTGKPSHLVDVALLFRNFDEYIESPATRELAAAFARDILTFIAGRGSSSSDRLQEGKVNIYGPTEVSVVALEDVQRDAIARATERDGVRLDALSDAWGNFIMGK